MGNNAESIFLCSIRRNLGKKIDTDDLEKRYAYYRRKFFPKLLNDPIIPKEDRETLRRLLGKPWNPYILRHSALTRQAIELKESTLRQHAGWTANSDMPLIYIHYFGNVASNELLKNAGVIPKDKQKSEALRPKQCPNCKESNKPDAKFCLRCNLVLSYDGYSETLEAASAVQNNVNTNEKIEKTLEKINNILDSDEWREFQEFRANKKK